MKKEENMLGVYLKELIQERGWSIRRFSEKAGVDAATVSRVINGKRQANLQHLQAFSACLGIPLSRFLQAAGHEEKSGGKGGIAKSIGIIETYLESNEMLDGNFSIEKVERKLNSCSELSETEEGKSMIAEQFEGKLEQAGGGGPFIIQLKEWHRRFRSRKGTAYELAVIGSALLYFIIPVDVIPDYLFPIGYIDDAIAVQLASQSLKG